MGNLSDLSFNPSDVDASGEGYDLIPPGWYQGVVVDTQIRVASTSRTEWLEVEIELPQVNNRKVWAKFFLWMDPGNPNAQKTEMVAKKQLAQLCKAMGISGIVQDSSQLIGMPFECKVAIEKDKTGQYEDKNGVKSFRPVGAGSKPQIGGARPAAPPASDAPPTAPGWARK